MAVIQKIQVPLLAVNDTILTVAEINMVNGSAVKKGDLLLVFETSKTTYDLFAESDGFIQYTCMPGNDYEVNDVIAIIFSTANEINLTEPISEGSKKETHVNQIKPVTNWNGETIFSFSALALIEQMQLKKEIFSDYDFVSKEDVERNLGISVNHAKTSSKEKSAKTAGFISPEYPENDLVTVEKISKSKQREIDYLSDVQSTGLTSTINTFTDTEGIFHLVNQNLRYFKNSLLPLIIYESARLLKKYPVLNAYFNNGQIAYYKEVNVGFAIDIDRGCC